MNNKSVFVVFAKGFEEIEAVTPVDMLRRLGYNVKTLGLASRIVTGAHGLPVQTDLLMEDADFSEADAILLPGGLPGAVNLRDSAALAAHLRRMNDEGKLLCAICAAPIVLKAAGVAEEKRMCGYPGAEGLSGHDDLKFTESMTETDANLVTGKGPGAAILFSAAVARALGTPEAALQKLLEGMIAGSC